MRHEITSMYVSLAFFYICQCERPLSTSKLIKKKKKEREREREREGGANDTFWEAGEESEDCKVTPPA